MRNIGNILGNRGRYGGVKTQNEREDFKFCMRGKQILFNYAFLLIRCYMQYRAKMRRSLTPIV